MRAESASGTSSSVKSSKLEVNAFSVGIEAMKRFLLQNLKDAPYERVDSVVKDSTGILDAIQKLGGDSSLSSLVDTYRKSVKEFLKAQEGIEAGGISSHDISALEDDLKSAKVAVEAAIHVEEDQKKRMEAIAKRKAELEALLQTLQDEELHLKEQHHLQLDVTSAAKSKVTLLRGRLEDAKASEVRASQLKTMKAKLEQCKKALEDAM